MRHDEVGIFGDRRVHRADRIADEALQFVQRLGIVRRAGGVGAGKVRPMLSFSATGRLRLQLPERIATVAMPAPTSSVPPVRLKMRIAFGLRTTLRARAATSA